MTHTQGEKAFEEWMAKEWYHPEPDKLTRLRLQWAFQSGRASLAHENFEKSLERLRQPITVTEVA